MSFETNFFQKLKSAEFDFDSSALELFNYQAEHVNIYRLFVELLQIDKSKIKSVSNIPFLPVTFFKSHKILATEASDAFCFTSSTTGGGAPSKHFVPNLEIYNWSFENSFKHFYSSPENFCVLGLLPSYLERQGSSLVHMVDRFIRDSKYPQSNFYLNNFEALHTQLLQNEAQKIPTLLIGVTYALLDFAEQFPMPLKFTTIMETGGMKGRREEMMRREVHELLKTAFHLSNIHSEYGMTELLSQAYSAGGGIFNTPPWMRVFAADLNDARTMLPKEKAGSLNIIDLANINSCAFIATDDLGLVHADNSFEVIGRKDNSDIRGCGLMYAP